MTIIADIVMFAWIPAVLLIFTALPARAAVITAYMGAWLFLPFVEYSLPGLPDYTKISATSVGILLATLLFHGDRVARFRCHWCDLPIVIFCLTPMASSVLNNLGLYDGLSAVLQATITWGAPYFFGRIYLGDSLGIRQLAIAVVAGGLIYIPFCLFEMRMSPQLHSLVYGSSHRWGGLRLGGWRPSVFLDSGIQLGLWMTACSLTGWWMWRTGAVKRIAGYSMAWLVPILTATTVLCRSTGALALLLVGVGALWFAGKFRSRLAPITVLLVAPAYLLVRSSGVWDGRQITELAMQIDEDRAQSFQFRIDNEEILIAKALQRPTFGWGGWGRSRVYDEWGKDVSVTDGLWVIELGTHGLVGLASLYGALLMPLGLLVFKFSARQLASADAAPALALAVCITLYAIDCLPNGMVNPVFMLMAGGVVSVAAAGAFSSANADAEKVGNGVWTRTRPTCVPQRRLHTGGVS